MTAAAVAAAAALPLHASQASIFAAMTAAAASARPSDFPVTTEADVYVTMVSSESHDNKQHSIYSVFLMSPVSLPTITDTGATQHTTNCQDLLHNFVLLPTPLQLMCADGGHIDCVGHGTLRRVTTINGMPSGVIMRNVVYVPAVSHTLVSPQQLLDAGFQVDFNQQDSFLFSYKGRPSLRSQQVGNLYHFDIAFTPATSQGATHVALSATHSPLTLELIH
jgi:hypothetical protein